MIFIIPKGAIINAASGQQGGHAYREERTWLWFQVK